jgi:hypothetical protein
LEQGRGIGVDLPDIRVLPWVKIQLPEKPEKLPVTTDLGAGDKEVLALGMQLPSAVVVPDDRLGRLHARALKLTVTGTLGVLLRAKAEGRIPGLAPILAELDRLGFRLSPRTRAAVLQRSGETSE